MKIYTFIALFITCASFAQDAPFSVKPFFENITKQFPNLRDLTFSANKDEAFFTAQSFMSDISVLITTKKIDGIWQVASIAAFSGTHFDLEPSFSPDGLSLYFASNRPLDNKSEAAKDFDIWYVTRENLLSPWSDPINLGAPINTSLDEFYPVITNSKNIYFTLDDPELNQKDNIYISEYRDGLYQKPKLLNGSINSDGYEFNAYVSPDEAVLIFTGYNKDDGYGSGDLYISHKLEDGQWGISKNLGPTINSEKMEYCPFVDMTTKTLYFTSKRNTLKLQPELTATELKTLFNDYENGLSKLYQADITKFLKAEN